MTLRTLMRSESLQNLTVAHRRGVREAKERCKLPLQPHAPARLIWDLVGLLFVIYDAVMIPLMLMVLHPGYRSDAIAAMTIIINLFWTFDIALTFVTSVVRNGAFRTSFAEIARAYARSWLIPDVLMVMSEWVMVVLSSRRGGFALLRLLKSLRAVRLLRAVKIQSVLQEQMKRVNSESMLHTLNLLQLIFAFLMLNHIMACAWFLIGKSSGSGWLEKQNMDPSSAGQGYLLALHWSITQFHGSSDVQPGNWPERIFAVVALICGMLIFSIFVSFIVDMIFQVRQARKKYQDQKVMLRRFFLRHTVSTQLMLAVKQQLNIHTDTHREVQETQELLQSLPTQLGRRLLSEVRQPTITSHWLFKWMHRKYSTALRDVCYNAFVPIPALMGQSVFFCMDACSQMYFVESGTLRYLPVEDEGNDRRHRSTFGPDSRFHKQLWEMKPGLQLDKGRWACEPALWVEAWQTHGELVATSNSVLLSLDCHRFAQLISGFPQLHFDITIYAHWFVRELKDSALVQMVDLWVPTSPGSLDLNFMPTVAEEPATADRHAMSVSYEADLSFADMWADSQRFSSALQLDSVRNSCGGEGALREEESVNSSEEALSGVESAKL